MQSSLYTPQAATFFLSSKSLERKSSIFYIPEGSFSHVFYATLSALVQFVPLLLRTAIFVKNNYRYF